ncbi:SDR family NAD(P)-dependent oxidoreductase [Phenylobacterium sp.]|jgi:NAD(P)-dependent dehydrogenase (short-subunit alcohol dehydrogenase family)|uniref:SDR family NAD(P)-dependent oxidoreductase n=1 Tax=Phenylobacterium sp. TaxID=1871053 RepID=UPI002F403FF2
MDLQLKGKRALVTGGSRGIGLAIARQLAREGASVAIAARDPAALEAAARALSDEVGTKVAFAAGDTGDDASARAMVETAAAALGGLDILVNSAARPAGETPPPKLAGVTGSLLWEEVNVKVMGYIRCAQAAAPYMIAQGWGRIVNISGLNARSAGALVGSVRNVAVSAMTKNLADELGPHGINVTVVHPGMTRTERMGPMLARRAEALGIGVEEMEKRMTAQTVIGRMVDAGEVADIVAFLASPRSVAITGDAIACGGGVKGPIYY